MIILLYSVKVLLPRLLLLSFQEIEVMFQNPGYMKEGFHITIETLHAPGDGLMENVSGWEASVGA